MNGSPTLKIAMVIINANRHEGTSRAVLEVAERLVQRGHQVDLIARTVEAIEGTGLNWVSMPGMSRPEVADFASFKRAVDRRLRGGHEYHIVHSAGPNTSQADVYTIQTVHPMKMAQTAESRTAATVGRHRRLSWWAYDRYVMKSERQAYTALGPSGPRAFLPVSEGTKRELLDVYPSVVGLDDNSDIDQSRNICVVPNGADLDRFSPQNRRLYRDDLRRQYGINADDFLLVFSGGDWRRKGLDLALQSLARLPDPYIKLLVVGHDRAGGDVRQMSDDLGLQGRVVFAGFCEDVHRYYAAGDLFLFPTSYEAFSLATIEAAASGLPVLMPDVSGAAELIGCGTTGTMIRREPDHIAETVMAYFKSPEKLDAAGSAARQLVEQRFNWDAITDATIAVYRSLIEQRGPVQIA
jgi:glycosyltransferase involved in cell wall biosynthesis